MVDALVLAAGQGSRAGLGYPKQLALLGGKPIMVHSLELFQSMPEIDSIILVAVPGREDDFAAICSVYGITKAKVVTGGATRQESVRIGLAYVATERVLIHESVRPFITAEFVRSLLALDGDAVVPVVEPTETITDHEGTFYDRSLMRIVQLPQVFDTAALQEAHYSASGWDREFTDDSSLYQWITEEAPTFASGLERNLKITSPLDLAIAEVILHETLGGDNGR